jgi:hypothetical protein
VKLNGVRGYGTGVNLGIGYAYRWSHQVWITGQLGFEPITELIFRKKTGESILGNPIYEGYEFDMEGIKLEISLVYHFSVR